MRIESFAVLVLKAFDKGRFAFDYKVGNLIIRELLLAFRIEEDTPGLAFGARETFTVRNRYLHLQKFFGDLGGNHIVDFAFVVR